MIILKLQTRLNNRRNSERGATATEYGLLAGFIAFVIVFGVGLFGTALDAVFTDFATRIAAIL